MAGFQGCLVFVLSLEYYRTLDAALRKPCRWAPPDRTEEASNFSTAAHQHPPQTVPAVNNADPLRCFSVVALLSSCTLLHRRARASGCLLFFFLPDQCCGSPDSRAYCTRAAPLFGLYRLHSQLSCTLRATHGRGCLSVRRCCILPARLARAFCPQVPLPGTSRRGQTVCTSPRVHPTAMPRLCRTPTFPSKSHASCVHCCCNHCLR